MNSMYYLLSFESIDKNKYFSLSGTLYNCKNELTQKIFGDGIRHEMKDPYLFILNESKSLINKRNLTDRIVSRAVNAGSLLLVSPKVQELLNKLLPDDVEMYEVQVKGSIFKLSDYKIVKVLDKIDCVDLEKSDLKYNESLDSITTARSFVLNEDKIPKGKRIFLLGKRLAPLMIVHESLKKAIEEAGLTGFAFYTLEEAYKMI